MYSRKVDKTDKIDERVLEFGTSGLLYQSNKLMYDRNTNTLWHQFLGVPVVGPLVDSGIKLELLPVLLTTWDEWRAAHPDTTVLDVNTGIYAPDHYRSEEDPKSTYYEYRRRSDTIFPVPRRSDRLPTKAHVLGLSINGHSRAYPLETLSMEPVINDSLGSEGLVVVTEGGARAYEGGAHTFSEVRPGEGRAAILVDERGRQWQVQEEALVLTEDPTQRLKRLPSRTAYWFGWYAFYPDTDVYGQNESSGP